jgi:lipid-A-disaccharide synthase
MKYYIIAGEASGDLHGSNLIKALKQKDAKAEIWAWGGDMMENAGAVLRKHYRDLAFMGFVEVVKNLKTILNNIAFCKKDISQFQPDAIIFIDYPGFNMRIAKWAKLLGFRTFYYISPQIWAWHTSRVHQIKKYIDQVYCILPFEKDFYKKYNYNAEYVGHPLLDVVKNHAYTEGWVPKNKLLDKPIVALMAGSRRQEVERILPPMLSVAAQFLDYQFVIAGAPSLPKAYYDTFLKNQKGHISLVENQTYSLLQHAKAALVKSGTSTLETALFGVPEVVCYKGSNISYQIAKRVVDIKYISLVNLIANKKVVTELIQDDLTTENIAHELRQILDNQAVITDMKKEYIALKELLGTEGAAERTAELIVGDIMGSVF